MEICGWADVDSTLFPEIIRYYQYSTMTTTPVQLLPVVPLLTLPMSDVIFGSEYRIGRSIGTVCSYIREVATTLSLRLL